MLAVVVAQSVLAVAVAQSVLAVAVANIVAAIHAASCFAFAVADLVFVIVANRLDGVVADLVVVIVGAPRFGAGAPGHADGIAVVGRFAVAEHGPAGALSTICPLLAFGISWDFLSHWGGLVRKPIPGMGCFRSTGFHPRD